MRKDEIGLDGAGLGLLGQEAGVDVGKNAALSDGDAGGELVQLLVVADCQLDVAWVDARLLVVPGSVSGQLQNLGGQVPDNGQVKNKIKKLGRFKEFIKPNYHRLHRDQERVKNIQQIRNVIRHDYNMNKKDYNMYLLHDGGQVDGCSGRDAIGVAPVLQETMDASDGVLETSTAGLGLGTLSLSSFATSGHLVEVDDEIEVGLKRWNSS